MCLAAGQVCLDYCHDQSFQNFAIMDISEIEREFAASEIFLMFHVCPVFVSMECLVVDVKRK